MKRLDLLFKGEGELSEMTRGVKCFLLHSAKIQLQIRGLTHIAPFKQYVG